MTSTAKLSQQELRQLMREKAQSKVVKRIDSPLAKYDEKGNLLCAVCNIIVHSEAFWTSHLTDKSHKKKIDELKQLRQPKPANLDKTSSKESKNGLKRSSNSGTKDSVPNKKGSKFDNISEFSKKEVLIKQNKRDITEEKSSESQKSVENATNSVISSDITLPQDFFDDEVQPVKMTAQNIDKSNDKNDNSQEDLDTGSLPKGFFDDPKLDAKSRKGKKDPFDEQMELFRKEIAQESIVSEVILEEEIEQIQKEKTLAEIEEQISKWEKVDEYQKRIDSIHKKREEVKLATKKDDDDDSDDSDEQANLDDMDFWRSKGAFH